MDGYRDLIDRIDGYTVGRLMVDGNEAFLVTDKGEKIELNDGFSMEVLNIDHYEGVTFQQLINDFTVEGWPLYAGLYARTEKN